MTLLTFWLLCIQACLVQNVFSQCIQPYAAPAGVVAAPMTCDAALEAISAPFVASVIAPLTESFLAPAAVDACTAYGGDGIGEAAIDGEIPAMGTTELAGQVPMLGAVEFGIIPAAGTVSIAGSCSSAGLLIL